MLSGDTGIEWNILNVNLRRGTLDKVVCGKMTQYSWL